MFWYCSSLTTFQADTFAGATNAKSIKYLLASTNISVLPPYTCSHMKSLVTADYAFAWNDFVSIGDGIFKDIKSKVHFCSPIWAELKSEEDFPISERTPLIIGDGVFDGCENATFEYGLMFRSNRPTYVGSYTFRKLFNRYEYN